MQPPLRSGPTLTDWSSILAIHGIPGDRIDSWRNHGTGTSENVMWLADLLPKHVPNARIMTFGHRQVPNGPSVLSSQGLRKIALEILKQLSSKRNKHQPPIVFICHSLGGVILKRVSIATCGRSLIAILTGVYSFSCYALQMTTARIPGLLRVQHLW